jgi:hypothetical protein
MRFASWCGITLLALVAVSHAGDLPEAPSSTARAALLATPPGSSIAVSATAAPRSRGEMPVPVIDKKFLSLAIISTGSTFADSYTTLFARENWLAGKQGVCNMETESPYLYGTHPTVARAYAVASLKSAGSAFAAYYLHRHHSRMWSLPLVANSIMSLQGVGQNLANCN